MIVFLSAAMIFFNVVSDTQSIKDNTDPYFFNADSVAWYWGHYLATPEDGRQPLASPLLARDLTGLPPALVITAEYDPLRDQGEAYARRLESAGVAVTLVRMKGHIHGSMAFTKLMPSAREHHELVHANLRDAYRRPVLRCGP